MKKLIEKAKQPKMPISVNILLKLLLVQGFMLLLVLLVLMIWPEAGAHGMPAFVFMSMGIAFGLWLEIREAGIQPKYESSEK